MLISGKGNGASEWHQVLDTADPVRDLATDEVLAVKGDIRDSQRAVYPTIWFYLYSPRLVIKAIRAIVADVRDGIDR